MVVVTLARMSNALQAKRTVDELKDLRALTSDADGAQRVAFTPSGAPRVLGLLKN